VVHRDDAIDRATYPRTRDPRKAGHSSEKKPREARALFEENRKPASVTLMRGEVSLKRANAKIF